MPSSAIARFKRRGAYGLIRDTSAAAGPATFEGEAITECLPTRWIYSQPRHKPTLIPDLPSSLCFKLHNILKSALF